MRRRRCWWLAATLLPLPVLTACGSGSSASPSRASATSGPSASSLPDVLLSDLDGNAVPMRSLTGRPLVINYWYSSCPPCDRELPALAAVAAEYAGRVTFIGVNPRDDAAAARSYTASRGVTYRQLLDRTNRSVDALSLTGFPTTVLVGGDGSVRVMVRHALTADELRALIIGKLAP